MNKYREMVIYTGNLMEYTNGKYELYKENTYLIYNSTLDMFYTLGDTLNYFFDLDLNDKLSETKKDECRTIISKHLYPYICKGIEGQIYVDESSIKVIIDNSNKHR